MISLMVKKRDNETFAFLSWQIQQLTAEKTALATDNEELRTRLQATGEGQGQGERRTAAAMEVNEQK